MRGLGRVTICDVKPEIVTRPSPRISTDRKSTRLNSSHANNSYAVFCLKKKSSLSANMSPRPTMQSASAIQNLTLTQVILSLMQVVRALEYLHAHDVLHSAIRLEKILLA